MRNKWFFLLMAGLFLSSLGNAQVIDQPVARVRLTKPEVITQKQLMKHIELLEQQTRQPVPMEGRRKILDLKIGEVLINQAAARDNFRVSDTELAESIEAYKRSIGAPVSDAQFRLLVQNQLNLTWDEFVANMRQRMIQERYILEKKRDLFASIKEATEEQVRDIYNAHATDFTNPLMVRFNHIFIDTRTLSNEEKNTARKRAEDALKELRNTPFKDVALKYSDDTGSKYRGGDFGYLARNDAQRESLLGKGFFDAVFSLQVNQTSGIITSNLGFHIVQLTERREPRLLNLDDPIFPGSSVTVRQRIKDLVRVQNQQLTFQRALTELIEELRKQAEVTIFEQNLNW
ncbi:MAG: peptidylprolyl isomerase [Spirochaetales bacterium]